jgi:hypothetical protein
VLAFGLHFWLTLPWAHCLASPLAKWIGKSIDVPLHMLIQWMIFLRIHAISSTAYSSQLCGLQWMILSKSIFGSGVWLAIRTFTSPPLCHHGICLCLTHRQPRWRDSPNSGVDQDAITRHVASSWESNDSPGDDGVIHQPLRWPDSPGSGVDGEDASHQGAT